MYSRGNATDYVAPYIAPRCRYPSNVVIKDSDTPLSQAHMASSRVESVPSQSYILKTHCIKIESRRKPKFRSKVTKEEKRTWLH
jgi:hypothetical protein